MMYFNLVLGVTSVFSITVSAFSFDSGPILPSDDLFATDTLSPIDQLADNSMNPPFDMTDVSSLSSSSLSLNLLEGSNLFENSQSSNPSSDDLLWDDVNDPLLLAAGGCSTSDDTILPPARGKLRLKQRSDGATECPNPDISGDSSGASSAAGPAAKVPPIMLPQVFEEDKHSITCWQLTLGMLPFAVAGQPGDVVDDPTRSYGFRIGPANAPYTPRTVYHATVIIGPAFFWNGNTLTYCCQDIQKYFTYTMGINCVLLHWLATF